MASIIRVKRSTGITPPSSLNFGELGLTIGVGTANNSGGRLFAGDNATNAQIVGGRYYTDLLSLDPGKVASQANPTTAANGFVAILDSDRKVDQWNVDNLTLDGNTFSSTNTDGDVIINPNGSGDIMIPDDTLLGFGGGSDGTAAPDATIEYDEDGDNKIKVSNKRLRRLAYLDVHQLNYNLFSLYNIYKKIITKDAANNQIIVLFIALAILFTLAYLLLV